MAAVGATVPAFGLAVAVLLGLALVLIPAGLAILVMESGRARRWLRNAKDCLLKANPLAEKETA